MNEKMSILPEDDVGVGAAAPDHLIVIEAPPFTVMALGM